MFGGKKQRATPDQPAYFGEVKVAGKYQQVTTKPHTKSAAKSVIARILDNTLAASGRIAPMKKQPKKGSKLVKDDEYYDRNKHKFKENFRMYKGRRVPTKNTLIEKKRYRLDKIGETKKISAKQFIAQGKLGRPNKKKMFRL